MEKQKLSNLKQLKFEGIKKNTLKTLKGGSGPIFTIERTWAHYDCPDFEED